MGSWSDVGKKFKTFGGAIGKTWAELSQICSINMGQSPDSSTYNENGKGLPFFQGNADFGELHPAVRVWCSEPVKIAKPNDILISVRAPIGALNIADTECCIGRGLAALTVNPAVCEQKYLWYGLENKVEELNSKGTGSTFKAISKNILSVTEIPLPSLTEQAHISALLDKISDLIVLRKQQLIKLDELVKARFVEMFGDIEHNTRQYPISRLGKVAFITKLAGFEYTNYIAYQDSGDIIMIRGLNCKKTRLVLDDIYWIDKKTSDLLLRSKLYKGDIVLTYVGTVGEVALIDADDRYHLAPNVAKISFYEKDKNIPTFWAYAFMYGREYIMKHAASTTQAALSMGKIRDIAFPIPPTELQQVFSDFAKKVDVCRLTVRRGLDKLETIRKALMQEHFG